MTTQVKTSLFAGGAVSERNVPICNIIEEVDLLFVKQQTGGDGVHGSIAPTLVEEAAILVKGLEKVNVRLAAKPVKVTNFKVGPLEIN